MRPPSGLAVRRDGLMTKRDWCKEAAVLGVAARELVPSGVWADGPSSAKRTLGAAEGGVAGVARGVVCLEFDCEVDAASFSLAAAVLARALARAASALLTWAPSES